MTTPSTASAAAPSASNAPGAGTVAAWPLTFRHLQFGVLCFDTQACEALYHGFGFGNPDPTPARASLTPAQYASATVASYGPVPRTAPPAHVRWRARDGAALEADIDIAALFADGLVRHETPREDIAEGVSIGATHVLLEVDDRTVNVYTRTMIPTKRPQIPGNPYSDDRNDLIRVWSRTY